ncbi:4'-phosphopantetheinyl transferase superfamily protein [Methylococcus sp. EFPC2]|uniref:4'-phosphopantetheinyl transferase family protein n=1 Tax=Methylococcus sp. EFPC2 TaxID=2812648 RepID=UPI001967B339|nr:4'-phosphopantetheinyl transferase superfamily protein [Methylococcus sp. EFPC2]QSA98862.1 4'-phosphopantetheinyl transferase superfamily protein [Methylococcus sp. EFPC2]
MDAASLDHSIHLWLIRHKDLADETPEHPICLSETERERAGRLRSETARARFVATRVWLRGLLGHYLNTDARDIDWEHNAHGKPRLAGQAEDQGLVFNLSHTGDYAALALTRDGRLGVDIELPKASRDLEGLAAMCLAPEELSWWREGAEDEKAANFFRLWVCKEAYVKAVGRGIALGLKRIAVKPDFSGFLRLPPEYGTPEAWHMYESHHGPCRLALVHEGEARPITVFASS